MNTKAANRWVCCLFFEGIFLEGTKKISNFAENKRIKKCPTTRCKPSI